MNNVKSEGLNNPRYIAFKILRKDRVFSQYKMSEHFQKSFLSSLDKSLVTQIVNGINREKLFLEWSIQENSSRPLSKIDKDVKILLLIGAYQILFMDRIPSYAAIWETVEAGKSFLKTPSVKYVNAVLRSIDRKKDSILKGPSCKEKSKYISLRYSHPEWLIRRWVSFWGEAFTEKLCIYNNKIPEVTIRVNPLKISEEELKLFLKESNIDFSPLKYLRGGFNILSGDRLTENPLYNNGVFTIQSESSMFPVRILDPGEGEQILDLCAAPGNKTTHIAELMNNKGKIIAVDISSKRFEFLKDNIKRLGIDIIDILEKDILALGDEFNQKFDRVLLDSPCTGTGVLSRRSDLRWNKKSEDIKRLAELQGKLLKKASSFVKPGGILLYSICSIEPEEGEENIEKFLKENNDFLPDNKNKVSGEVYEKNRAKRGILLLPADLEIEGFFISRLKKIK